MNINEIRFHITIPQCLKKLQEIELPFAERSQLEGLVRDLGWLGAIRYLEPLSWENPGRNQHLADKHREILEGLCYTKPTVSSPA